VFRLPGHCALDVAPLCTAPACKQLPALMLRFLSHLCALCAGLAHLLNQPNCHHPKPC
jgi:hypothetical protein